jgi:stage II sporulation protein R
MKKFLEKEITAKFVLIPTAVFLGLVITICITAITSFAEEYENIQENVLRLHILANSDSEADQELKLKVRDAVLTATEDVFTADSGGVGAAAGQPPRACRGETNADNNGTSAAADTDNGAVTTAAANLDIIYNAAMTEIRANGYDYDVAVELVDMTFDARVYDVNGKDFTMPAGEYTAVRVTIGEAKGKNWWCVMFPPLCLPAVTENADAVMTDGFTDEQIDIMSEPEKYEAKLYVVELWKKVFDE